MIKEADAQQHVILFLVAGKSVVKQENIAEHDFAIRRFLEESLIYRSENLGI